MRIATSTVSDNVVRQIQRLGTQQSKLQSQVASGQRVVNPSDDPAAVGRLINLESERRSLMQFARNSDRAMEVSQATFSGLQQLKKISDRITELSTLGSGTVSAEARKAYALEADQLLEQSLQLGNTRFHNDFIFAGTAVDAQPFAVTRDADGKITSSSFNGNSEQASIAVSESSHLKTGASPATNQGIGEFINRMIALRDALNNGAPGAVAAVHETLLASEDLLVDSLAEQGSVQMRIEVGQVQQQMRAENLERLISSEADTDLASSIVALNQTQVAYQAALQSSANIMRLSLLDYLR
ncbi:MAG: flagellar hook-associated protein FlgL [Candidatus Didemnitutus sp.]|nr:flagellar hook-associated protein FlgL [Candidatus Didemnitutus sp.]